MDEAPVFTVHIGFQNADLPPEDGLNVWMIDAHTAASLIADLNLRIYDLVLSRKRQNLVVVLDGIGVRFDYIDVPLQDVETTP